MVSRRMSPIAIDTVAHHYTGRQILAALLNIWRKEPNESVLIYCRRLDAEWKKNAIRVALSKARKANSVNNYFGIRTSATFPCTHRSGDKIEGFIIKMNQTRNQKLAYAFDTKVLGVGSKKDEEGDSA